MSESRTSDRFRWLAGAAFAVILLLQVFICFQGVADQWTRGHNGWNGSAYHQSARNSIRWGHIFPVQYDTTRRPPDPAVGYTHHPLAMHAHNVAALEVFGDSPASIRAVPATHGVLAVLALLLVVRRFWGTWQALLAGAIYVALPINGIYANMMNHSSGFIFWMLLSFYGYLRWREAREEDEPTGRWYALWFAAFGMAGLWDWPAYYVAFGLFVHALVEALARQRAEGKLWQLGPRVLALIPWCVWVLLVFGSHFLLVYYVAGSWEELAATFQERQSTGGGLSFFLHLSVVPPLMFTWPVLAMCLLWIFQRLWFIARGRFNARDIIPLSFGIAGMLHYGIFKWSAVIHSYWAWTALPFVAIATADVTIQAGRLIRDRLADTRPRWQKRLAFAAGFLLLVPLVFRSVDLVPRGRAVGGSLWFEEPVRKTIQEYSSGRAELRFARKVNEWTTRSTLVIVHESILTAMPERRFDITLDREQRHVADVTAYGPKAMRPGLDSWVFIGLKSALPAEMRAGFAALFRYREYDEFFFVDFTAEEPSAEIWTLEEAEPDWTWRLFYSAFEPPVDEMRDHEAEELLREQAEAFLSRERRRFTKTGDAP